MGLCTRHHTQKRCMRLISLKNQYYGSKLSKILWKCLLTMIVYMFHPIMQKMKHQQFTHYLEKNGIVEWSKALPSVTYVIAIYDQDIFCSGSTHIYSINKD